MTSNQMVSSSPNFNILATNYVERNIAFTYHFEDNLSSLELISSQFLLKILSTAYLIEDTNLFFKDTHISLFSSSSLNVLAETTYLQMVAINASNFVGTAINNNGMKTYMPST